VNCNGTCRTQSDAADSGGRPIRGAKPLTWAFVSVVGWGWTRRDGGTFLRIRRLGVRVPPSAREIPGQWPACRGAPSAPGQVATTCTGRRVPASLCRQRAAGTPVEVGRAFECDREPPGLVQSPSRSAGVDSECPRTGVRGRAQAPATTGIRGRWDGGGTIRSRWASYKSHRRAERSGHQLRRNHSGAAPLE